MDAAHGGILTQAQTDQEGKPVTKINKFLSKRFSLSIQHGKKQSIIEVECHPDLLPSAKREVDFGKNHSVCGETRVEIPGVYICAIIDR